MTPDGIFPGKVLLGSRLIDDGNVSAIEALILAAALPVA